jgi:hypothetical protein
MMNSIMVNTRTKYSAGDCACGHVVMETYEDPAPRCASGQVVCGSCQEENHGIVCRECAAPGGARRAQTAGSSPTAVPPTAHPNV